MFQTSEGNTMFSPPGFQETIKTNRLVFDTAYQWMCLVQDQMENLTENWLDPTFAMPQKIGKQQRETIKKTIDVGFETLEVFLEPKQPEKSSQKESDKVKEAKTEQKESSGKQKESSEKGGTNKSTPSKDKNSSAKSSSAK